MTRIATADPCRRAMGLVHRELDGESLAPVERDALETHLAACHDCREAAGQLASICRALSDLPRATMPPHAVGRLLRETAGRPGRGPRRLAWRGMSAAAAALLVALTAWSLRDGATPAPVSEAVSDSGESTASASDAQVAAAAHDIRLAFALVAREIDRTEKIALDHVVNDRFAPALARVPLFNAPEETRR